MKNLYSIYVLTLTFIFLMSCDNSIKKNKKSPIDNTITIEQEETVAIYSVTENKFAYIKGFDKRESSRYVKVDYVDYLCGQEALGAEWRDEAYFVDGDDTITNITNGYYISNVNPKLRIFRLEDKISVDHIIDDNGTQILSPSKPLDSKQIELYINNVILLFLHIENGLVVRIDERFMP